MQATQVRLKTSDGMRGARIAFSRQAKNLAETRKVREFDNATRNDRVIERAAVWDAFVQTGHRKLVEINGLSEEENFEMLHTPVIEHAIELMLIGLS